MLRRAVHRLQRLSLRIPANRQALSTTRLGGDCSDGIFRRPQTQMEAATLPEDAELTHDDAQCPEPSFDVDPDIGLLQGAFRMAVAFGLIATFYNLLPDPQDSPACPGPDGNVVMYQEDYMQCRHPSMVEQTAPAADEGEE
eukprot:jgi/Bigna1/91425/estExt_fgenesh1_pg.C_1000041